MLHSFSYFILNSYFKELGNSSCQFQAETTWEGEVTGHEARLALESSTGELRKPCCLFSWLLPTEMALSGLWAGSGQQLPTHPVCSDCCGGHALTAVSNTNSFLASNGGWPCLLMKTQSFCEWMPNVEPFMDSFKLPYGRLLMQMLYMNGYSDAV